MTTTSTTGYVDVESPSVHSYMHPYMAAAADLVTSEAWSTLQEIDFESYPNRADEHGPRLQKPHRGARILTPADPAEVLARPTYNHVSETVSNDCPCLRRFKSLPKLPRTYTHSPPKSSVSPTTQPSATALPVTSRPTASPQSTSQNPRSAPRSTFPSRFPRSSSGTVGCGQAPQLHRQKSMAKVLIDSFGRLASKCRSVKLHGDAKE